MKIALINAQTNVTTMREMYGYHENLGLNLLNSYFRENNFESDVFDLRIQKLTNEEMAQKVCENEYDVASFSINYATAPSAMIIAQLIKFNNPNCIVTFGGEHATYLDEKIITEYEFVDYIVRGEGEESSLSLMKAIANKESVKNIPGISYRDENGQYVKNPNRMPIEDLDKLPFASKDIVKYAIKNKVPVEVGILAQRGCPFKCTFCNGYKFFSNEFFEGKTRVRSPKNVVDEMETLVPIFKENHNLTLHFYDATFVTKAKKNREWMDEFMRLIEERNIHIPFDAFIRADSFDFDTDKEFINRLINAGLVGTYIGLEAGDDDVLELYNKNVQANDSSYAIWKLREFGIEGSTNGVICFHQTVKLKEVRHTINFLADIGFCSLWNITSKAETLPGIKLDNQMELASRKTLWDVENYKFANKDVENLYNIVVYLKENYFIAQYEDKIIRNLREQIKLKIFYADDKDMLKKVKKSFEADVTNLQLITKTFFNELIDDINNKENVTIESYKDKINKYASELGAALQKINIKYLEILIL